MSAAAHAGGARFQAGVVVDAHVHTADYLPAFAASVYRWATRRTVPPLFFLDQLASAGVDAVVVNAVGDRAAAHATVKVSRDSDSTAGTSSRYGYLAGELVSRAVHPS